MPKHSAPVAKNASETAAPEIVAPEIATQETAAASKDLHTVTLDTPVMRGETEVRTITLRRPKAGELRGLSIADIARLEVDAMLKLLPRITTPVLNKAELEAMPSEDLTALSNEAGSFLLQRSDLAASRIA